MQIRIRLIRLKVMDEMLNPSEESSTETIKCPAGLFVQIPRKIMSASQNNIFSTVLVLHVALSREMQHEIASTDLFISGGLCYL